MSHKIPAEFESEEKLFGGILTLKQFVFLAAGGTVGAVSVTLPLPLVLRLFLFGLFFSVGAALAFVKVWDMTLPVFLFRLVRYRRRPRKVLFITGNQERSGQHV